MAKLSKRSLLAVFATGVAAAVVVVAVVAVAAAVAAAAATAVGLSTVLVLATSADDAALSVDAPAVDNGARCLHRRCARACASLARPLAAAAAAAAAAELGLKVLAARQKLTTSTRVISTSRIHSTVGADMDGTRAIPWQRMASKRCLMRMMFRV